MKIYNGNIPENFLRGEISFQVELPEFCKDQEFKLLEITPEGKIYLDDFTLLLNNGENIVEASNGIASYTGSVNLGFIETVVIAQVTIERSRLSGFTKRKFMLEVV